MRAGAWLATGLATSVGWASTIARADDKAPEETHPFALLETPSNEAKPMAPEDVPPALPPGYFGDIGTEGRWWQIHTDTSLTDSRDRVFTQRLLIARAFRLTGELSVVGRVSMATETIAAQGVYGIQGPIPSLGVRDQTESGSFSIEVGLKLLPNWTSPDESLPSAQKLALDSTLSSGIGDDAQWLPLADVNFQIYALVRSQIDPFGSTAWTFVPGVQYGGEASLLPVYVQSWLGPQAGFVGNVFLELYFTAPRLANHDANLRVGGHGDLSLSTIWPAGVPFPVVGNAFLEWSPEYWFSARIFSGVGGSPGAGQAVNGQYGFRLDAFLP